MRFRAETDKNLKKHLQNASRIARYTSKIIQNQLIDIIGKRIQLDILSEVKEAKFYTSISQMKYATFQTMNRCHFVFAMCGTAM